VEHTLTTSGFSAWVEDSFPGDMPEADAIEPQGQADGAQIRHFVLDGSAGLAVNVPADWRPWSKVETDAIHTLTFPENTFALGIGSPAATVAQARDHLGEFVAAAQSVVFQPPDEQARPDYLVAGEAFHPAMQVIQAITFQGDMGGLLRFAPSDEAPFYPLSRLLAKVLDHTNGRAAGFVLIGEIEGLVGTALIRSPGLLDTKRSMEFPEVRDWLTFCGERSHAYHQALMTGVVSRSHGPLVASVPSVPDLFAHVHAAVFPHQPLPNGRIALDESVKKVLAGPPPLAVMHLAEDARPVVGLGESALIRGAVWFGALFNPEVLS
jgi:hypothetical protein